MSSFTRGELAEIDAGVRPSGAFKTVTFDGGASSGALAAKATVSTSLTGTNNDIAYTAANNGLAGNATTVEYSRTRRQPGSDLLVEVDDQAIIVNLKTSAGVKASTVLTSSNTNVTNGKKVVIGGTTYTFKDTLAAVGDVKKGASADATLLSLAKTINGTGTAGTDMFAGTPAHTQVDSTAAVASHTITLTAKSVGTAGNAFASTTDETTLSFTGATFAGGEDVNQVLSTADEIKTAIAGVTAAAALVATADVAGNDGSGVVTEMAAVTLAGGSDGTIPLFNVTGGVVCSLRGYCETDLAGTNATLVHGVTGTTNALIPILTSTNIEKTKGIDKSAAVVARGTALDATPVWYVQDEQIFATTATAATTAGKINYILDYKAVTEGAYVTAA